MLFCRAPASHFLQSYTHNKDVNCLCPWPSFCRRSTELRPISHHPLSSSDIQWLPNWDMTERVKCGSRLGKPNFPTPLSSSPPKTHFSRPSHSEPSSSYSCSVSPLKPTGSYDTAACSHTPQMSIPALCGPCRNPLHCHRNRSAAGPR